ncbi:pilus assembly protein TadG-related protein [Paraburkholderia pallida]|uniref:Putative Flp pilus-assembly TadG-like N-terminal domain-containing protein n=1 Tax=Paraburkholderia pallida TaxID=2547399 RepID=A0A4P7CY99_9BURK|nr:pilus assembly protein TadG-related protein [Paraburkholderia pallida]QBR01259.1 hypothetical protein E1956_29045 [Paraburkholderia pallida]
MKTPLPRPGARFTSRSGWRKPASRKRQRGVSSLMLLVLLIPLLLAVGVAVDLARMVQFRSDLQNAVDEAALAGAAVFVDPTQSAQAVTAATNYFNRAILPVNLSVSAPTVTPNANGTINPALGSALAYTITVSATATVPTTLMAIVAPSMATISATATAADPVVSATPQFTKQVWTACDGNTLYYYKVPKNASNTGYDYSSVPAFNTQNYFWIFSTYPSTSAYGKAPAQTVPTFSANQPIGIMLRNDTNGNVGNSNCPGTITGANSYGAPNGASQSFYSSLIMNGQSPSELSNYTYTASVTTTGSSVASTTTTTVTTGSGTNATSNTTQSTSNSTTSNGVSNWTISLPPNAQNPNNQTLTGTGPSGSNQLAELFGVNAPGTANSACTTLNTQTTSGSPVTSNGNPVTQKNGSTRTTTQTTTVTTPTTTVTQYSCKTQYRTSQQGQGNCLLYVQTGSAVTSAYVKGLVPGSTPPTNYNCFNATSGGAQYSAPSCAQLSALASGSGTSAVQPAAVFWWDDGGGVGPNEQNYGTKTHCAPMAGNPALPGYGEDCKYGNMILALQCTPTGGSGTGYTSVVLTQ